MSNEEKLINVSLVTDKEITDKLYSPNISAEDPDVAIAKSRKRRAKGIYTEQLSILN